MPFLRINLKSGHPLAQSVIRSKSRTSVTQDMVITFFPWWSFHPQSSFPPGGTSILGNNFLADEWAVGITRNIIPLISNLYHTAFLSKRVGRVSETPAAVGSICRHQFPVEPVQKIVIAPPCPGTVHCPLPYRSYIESRPVCHNKKEYPPCNFEANKILSSFQNISFAKRK